MYWLISGEGETPVAMLARYAVFDSLQVSEAKVDKVEKPEAAQKAPSRDSAGLGSHITCGGWMGFFPDLKFPDKIWEVMEILDFSLIFDSNCCPRGGIAGCSRRHCQFQRPIPCRYY